MIKENEKDIYFDYMNLKFIDVDINKLKTFNPDTIGLLKLWEQILTILLYKP